MLAHRRLSLPKHQPQLSVAGASPKRRPRAPPRHGRRTAMWPSERTARRRLRVDQTSRNAILPSHEPWARQGHSTQSSSNQCQLSRVQRAPERAARLASAERLVARGPPLLQLARGQPDPLRSTWSCSRARAPPFEPHRGTTPTFRQLAPHRSGARSRRRGTDDAPRRGRASDQASEHANSIQHAGNSHA